MSDNEGEGNRLRKELYDGLSRISEGFLDIYDVPKTPCEFMDICPIYPDPERRIDKFLIRRALLCETFEGWHDLYFPDMIFGGVLNLEATECEYKTHLRDKKEGVNF